MKILQKTLSIVKLCEHFVLILYFYTPTIPFYTQSLISKICLLVRKNKIQFANSFLLLMSLPSLYSCHIAIKRKINCNIFYFVSFFCYYVFHTMMLSFKNSQVLTKVLREQSNCSTNTNFFLFTTTYNVSSFLIKE